MANCLPGQLFPFMKHFLKPYKGIVVLFVLFALLAGFWGPFNSLLIKAFINTLTAKTSQELSSIELLNRCGLYKTLWDVQVGGFLPDERKEGIDDSITR